MLHQVHASAALPKQWPPVLTRKVNDNIVALCRPHLQ
jgi:hypothetical protein